MSHALIALALLLGETVQERVSAMFSMLESGGLCPTTDFLELSEATGQEELAKSWLKLNEVAEKMDQQTFTKDWALLWRCMVVLEWLSHGSQWFLNGLEMFRVS